MQMGIQRTVTWEIAWDVRGTKNQWGWNTGIRMYLSSELRLVRFTAQVHGTLQAF